MKKIITAVAAVAMAASAFAVDFSAAIKMNGSLFDMTFVEGAKPSALKLEQPKAQKGHGQTGIDLNVSADKAGASLNIGNGYGGTSTLAYQGYKLWVSPVDGVKLNLGGLDYNLNKESLDYAGCINGTGSEGFGLDVSVAGFTANVVLNPGFGKSWIDNGVVGSTAVYAKYNAGAAGTIGLAWLGTPEEKSFENNTISLGYSNAFGPVSMFADVALDLQSGEKALKDVKADLFVKANVDAFGVAAYIVTTIDPNKEADGVSLGAKAKLSYNLGAATPYLYVKAPNFLGKPYQMEIKPGVNFNIGAAGCEVAVDIQNLHDKDKNPNCDWKVSVPFGVSLSF